MFKLPEGWTLINRAVFFKDGVCVQVGGFLPPDGSQQKVIKLPTDHYDWIPADVKTACLGKTENEIRCMYENGN